ncbi:MAG: hypothetical protein RIQ46_786 [Pseudomonadota bacterium]
MTARFVLSAAILAAAAAVLSVPATASGGASSAPPAAFAQCAACHAVEPGRTVFGPSLAGLAGRRAGSVPGYAYSPALAGSGLTWNAKTLDRWLAGPQRLVPGTKMPFGGMTNTTQRKQVVDYLMTLR